MHLYLMISNIFKNEAIFPYKIKYNSIFPATIYIPKT